MFRIYWLLASLRISPALAGVQDRDTLGIHAQPFNDQLQAGPQN